MAHPFFSNENHFAGVMQQVLALFSEDDLCLHS